MNLWEMRFFEKNELIGNTDGFLIDGDKLIPFNVKTEKRRKIHQDEMYGRLRW